MPVQNLVVKIIAAGEAGLTSLPYFLDEFVAHGIPLLNPVALDHEDNTLNRFDVAMRQPERQNLFRKHGYQFDREHCGEEIGSNEAVDTSIRERKKIFYQIDMENQRDENTLYDRPAALAEWAILHARDYWREFLKEWKIYQDNGNQTANRLIILVPYCPEGPTSGTVGIVLSAALREHIEEAKRSGLLPAGKTVDIWGIELCPPMNYDDVKDVETLRNNAYRGFVARAELFQRVEVLTNGTARRPFDLCVAVDGSREKTLVEVDDRQLLVELDKIAAHVAVSLVEGAVGGDFGEAMQVLKDSWRWHAYVYNIRSDTSVLEALRYLKAFPRVSEEMAENDKMFEEFAKASNNLVNAFKTDSRVRLALEGDGIRRARWSINEKMINDLIHATETWRGNLSKTNQLKNLVASTELELKKKFRKTPVKRKLARERTQLEAAQKESREAVRKASEKFETIYNSVVEPNSDNSAASLLKNSRTRPFGIDIELNHRMSEEFLNLVSMEEPPHLVRLLRRARTSLLRREVGRTIGEVLKRYIWDPKTGRSQNTRGSFSRILLVPIGHHENDALLPPVDTIALHVDHNNGSVEIKQPNPEIVTKTQTLDASLNGYYLNLSILVMASNATLEDVCSFQDLAQVYYKIRNGSEEEWLKMVRYHLNVPGELIKYYNNGRKGHVTTDDGIVAPMKVGAEDFLKNGL